jgi:lysophospholipase L1-like esterase
MKNPGFKVSVGLNVVLVAAGIAAAWLAMGLLASFTEQLFERRQTQFEVLSPSGGILFVGDSITEGGMWAELFDRPDVWNRGIGGDTTAGVLSRMDTLAAIAPKQVFLMIGVNDLNQGVPRGETLDNYEAILDAFGERMPGAEIVVQSVLPVSPAWPWASNEDIHALNEAIRGFSADRGLRYVDLHPLVADAEGWLQADLTNDGIHLLGAAYARWRDHLAPMLQSEDLW